ncbi:Hypp4978 [Branchiostoma lanceolatum]|uniref:Hypp4978 protein n=1 Tax=Branchiostoma lanceolatum TaxID=7740 RepID=A0A8K0ADR5_BRALA|nr:Hypp4978 [Branchiostoma lanceolatum]
MRPDSGYVGSVRIRGHFVQCQQTAPAADRSLTPWRDLPDNVSTFRLTASTRTRGGVSEIRLARPTLVCDLQQVAPPDSASAVRVRFLLPRSRVRTPLAAMPAARENGRRDDSRRDDASDSDTEVSSLKRLEPVLIVPEGRDALDSICPEYACSDRSRLWLTSMLLIGCFILGAVDCYSDWQSRLWLTSMLLIGCFILGAVDCYSDWQAYGQLVFDTADPAPTFPQRWGLFVFCAVGTLLFLWETLLNNLLEYCAMPHLDVELTLILVLSLEEIPLRIITYVTSVIRGRAAFWAMFSGWVGLLTVTFLHGLRMYKRSYHGSMVAVREKTFYRGRGVALTVVCHALYLAFFVLTVVQTAHYTTHKL